MSNNSVLIPRARKLFYGRFYNKKHAAKSSTFVVWSSSWPESVVLCHNCGAVFCCVCVVVVVVVAIS